jgi:hypothetical protein
VFALDDSGTRDQCHYSVLVTRAMHRTVPSYRCS